jgi:dUTP pyrophosphatase
MKLRIQKTRQVTTPSRSHEYDAGLDFYIPNDLPWDTYTVWPKNQLLIPSGIKADIPEGFALFCFEKSSMATKGLIVGARVVDAEYQGEIHIHIINVGKEQIALKPGMKLAQFVLIPIVKTDIIEVVDRPLYDEVTSRATGGFGSTGNGLPARTDYKWDIEKALEEQKEMPKQYVGADFERNEVTILNNLTDEEKKILDQINSNKGVHNFVDLKTSLSGKVSPPLNNEEKEKLVKAFKEHSYRVQYGGKKYGKTSKSKKPSKGQDEENE